MEPQKFGDNLILIERLAAGGMGEVFKAKQTGTGGFEKTVAVKRILSHFATRADFAKRFQQEMWVAAKLQHSNIAQVYSNGSFQDYLYLVMEYVKGKTLSEMIADFSARDEHIPIEHACFIISEVAKGLHYAHSLRDEQTGEAYHLVHRDVSPQNIMCNENGEVKVLDFGIAKVMDNLSELSRADDVKGKLQYVSPEQLEGERATPQSDIFALGIVMYELLTLNPLFLDNNTFQTMINVRELEIPNVSAIRSDVPRELQDILQKALVRDPRQRYASAQDFHLALSSFLSRTAPSYSPTLLGSIVQSLRMFSPNSLDSLKDTGALPLKAKTRGRTTAVARPRRNFHVKRRLLAVVLASCIGLAIGSAYVAVDRAIQNATPKVPVATFIADDLAFADGAKVPKWKARTVKGEVSFSQSSEQAQPSVALNVLNNHAVVRFDGAQQFLTSESAASVLAKSSDATFMMVVKVVSQKIGYITSIQPTNRHDDVVRLGIDAARHLRVKTTEVPDIQLFYTDQDPLPEGFVIVTLKLRRNTATLFVNGRQVAGGQTLNVAGFKRGAVMSLAQEFDFGAPSDFLAMDLAELIVFDGAIDPYLQSLLEGNLATKYDLKVASSR
jgi:serine/threonine protein kinase